MTTISSKDEDYLLDTSNRGEHELPPQVVTVSGIDELQTALRGRDDRIAFLEKELVETRLQLASAKTREDQLNLRLRGKSRALEKFEKATRSSRPPVVSDGEGEVSSSPRPKTISSEDIQAADTSSAPQPRVIMSSMGMGSTRRMPLGKPIVSHDPRPTLTIASRKCNVEPAFSGGSYGGGGGFSSNDSFQNLNPGSCASGLDLLAGDIPSGSNMNLSQLNSSSSINRMFVDIGLNSQSSEHSLSKKRRSGSGDRAAGHRRMHTTAGNYQGNDSWNNIDRAAGHHRRAHTTTTTGSNYQGNAGWGNAGLSAPVSSRPQAANMFVNCMLSSRSSSFSGGNRDHAAAMQLLLNPVPTSAAQRLNNSSSGNLSSRSSFTSRNNLSSRPSFTGGNLSTTNEEQQHD